MLLKNFACGGLSTFLHFNFVHDSIKYLCATLTVVVKNFPCAQAFVLLVFQFRLRFNSLFVCSDKRCKKIRLMLVKCSILTIIISILTIIYLLPKFIPAYAP